MNFFSAFPETLITVNYIFSPKLFGQWATTVIGIAFLAVLFASWGWWRFKKNRPLPQAYILALIAVAWLPLALPFFQTRWAEAKTAWLLFNAPEQDQIRWHYCQIDDAQKLGGGLCFLPDFIEEVEEKVPAGSRVILPASYLNSYLRYYLYGQYRIETDMAEADYYLAYRPPEGLVLLDNDRLYRLNEETPGDIEQGDYLGDFEVVGQTGPNQMILKRLDR